KTTQRFQQALKELEQKGRVSLKPETAAAELEGLVQLLLPKGIEIDSQFKDLLPPSSPSEQAELERQLLAAGGCRDPLIVWIHEGRAYLIDGHTRLALCRKHGLTYEIVVMEFPDREAVIRWIREHHYGRRSLSPEAASYTRGWMVNAVGMSRGGDHRSELSNQQRAGLKQRTAEVAERFQVSILTIERDRMYAWALDRISVVCG